MKQERICQFFIVLGDKEFRPPSNGDVYINITGVLDNNLIKSAIYRAFNKKNNEKIKVSNEIIFLIPNMSFKDRCQEIISDLNIRGRIELLNEKQELINNHNISASGSKTIEVQKETGIDKVTISDNKAYVNNGNLSIDEQKKLLLQEWMKDPYMSSKVRNLDASSLDKLLIENVTRNLTVHRMENTSEQLASDEVGSVAMDKASNEDGLVNTRLGIVKNNASNSNQYSVVEQSGENIQVVNARVTSSNINTGGINSSTSGDNLRYDYERDNMVETNEQLGEIDKEFYVDYENNVYDSDSNYIGKNGQDGLVVYFEDNTLMKNGQKIGYIGNYNDMGKNIQNSKNKSNVRVLKKPENVVQNKSAAFVSLPVIMFVLSAMLLVGSLILLFVLE